MAEKPDKPLEWEFNPDAPDEGLEALGNLEKKILLALSQLKKARAEKEEMRGEKSDLQRRISDQDQQLRDLRTRLARLEGERETVRSRVERLIAQVDSISPES